MINNKSLCLLFGSVFVLVGIAGFFPNPLVSSVGIFEVNAMHNLVHILTGTTFLVGGLFFEGKESVTLKSITTAYFGVAVLGFFTSGNMLLGIVHINEADRWLHLGLAVAMLAAVLAVTSSKTKSPKVELVRWNSVKTSP